MSSVCLPLQALKSELVPFLLRLLEGGLEAVDNPSATKAQIVKALKAMQRSLQYGEQVSAWVMLYAKFCCNGHVVKLSALKWEAVVQIAAVIPVTCLLVL